MKVLKITPTRVTVEINNQAFIVEAEGSQWVCRTGGWRPDVRDMVLADSGIQFAIATAREEDAAKKAAEEEAVAARRAEEDALISRARAKGTECFIRYGSIPECGYSYNHQSRYAEEGVSCYKAYKLRGEGIVVDLTGVDPLGFIFIGDNRRAYEVIGTVIPETGSDGEPLLEDAEIVRKIRKNTRITGARKA